jgi:hypothetical protein
MTDPQEKRSEGGERDELDLDAETVKDLEADADSAEAVRGGACKGLSNCTVVTGPSMDCPTR